MLRAPGSQPRPTVRRSMVLLLALLLAPSAIVLPGFGPPQASAQATTNEIERVASVEGITEYRLGNGMKVLLFPDAAQPTLTVNTTYFVGSKHEGYGETGMAHLLEHLVFKGTDRHPNIPEELSLHGGQANGTTSFERTNYYQTMPPTEENLAWALDLEADRMVNSWIRAEDLESEMTVVRNEWEAGENAPAAVLQKRVFSTAYQWHGYGRTPIGARSDIEGVPIERLQAFYRRFYQPDNAVVVIAGRFDEERALELVQQTFGAIPRPDRSTPDMQLYPTYTREPAQDGERQVTVRRVGDVQVVMVAYHVPAGTHDDAVPLDLLTHVLGNAPSGRLYQALVETEIASGVGVGLLAQREPGLLIVNAQVRTDQSIEQARDVLLRTLDELESNPPTEEEVERARAARLRGIRLSLTDVARVGLALSEWEALGDWRMMFINRDRTREANPEDLARVAKAYLLPSNRTIGLFIPEENAPLRAMIPEAPDVATLAAGYVGGETLVAAEAFEPTPENIEARTRRVRLPSGMSLALLPKPTRGQAVVASLTLRFGDEQSLTGRRTPGMLVPYMLSRGTERRTRQQVTDELARLESTLGISGTQLGASANVQTTRANLPAVLRILAESLREPAFDEQEFELLRRQLLATLENQRSDPGALASSTLNQLLNPYPETHPHFTPTPEQSIEWLSAASVDELREFHAEFYGAGPSATFAIVGDFDPDEVESLVQELFDDWTPATPFERVAQPHREVAPLDRVIETPDRSNAYFYAGLNLPIRDEAAEYPALVMANYLLGGGFLSSRLAERVRQQDGLSYGINSGLGASPLDESGRFMVMAIAAPENVARVEAAILEELERALREGFSEEEVEAGIAGWLQSRQVARATDTNLASMLNNGLYLDRTIAWDADLEARISNLTAADVTDALREHVDPDDLIMVKAGDFEGVAAGAP